MQIGLSSLAAASCVYFPDVDVYRGFEIIAGSGVSHIEYSDQTRPSYLDSPQSELESIRRHAADLGLTLWSAHSPCGATSLSTSDQAERERSIAVHERCLDGLAALGISHFVVHQIDGGEDETKDERLRLGLDSVFRIRRYAAQYGITLLIENFVFFKPEELLGFLEVTGTEGMGIVIDTGHEWQMGRSPAQAIRLAGDLLVSLHMQDNHGKGSTDEHLPPGYGTTDWPEVMRALSDVAYSGPYMMEVIPHVAPIDGMTPQQVVQTCFENMQAILREAAS